MKAYFNGVKKSLAGTELCNYYINATKTAVITIDMHRGHLDAGPDCPCPAPRARAIIKPIDKFTAACRQLGMPIIHVRSVLRKDGSDDVNGNISAWRLVFPMTVGDIAGSGEHALEGTKWTEFAIRVEEKDYIVNGKKRLSAFYPTDLELLLRNLHKETIVLVGTMTDCCVLNTAFDGANRDFRIIVPRDLCRGFEDLEEPALRIISLHLGLVVDSGDLLQAWQEQLAD
ncbi:cysteine hydrolase family protein [Sporomusa acidovorans]|uniref:Peroxyureidoacrylate/ureidoacrylate amidohydrolase RutB n=1 Tax=Sporomusa acidovorans (strain ATCC 49682 / DSM 3132 / Mol) TaxID=1123286 RepID=A0ABZ3J8L6_SPOA4|nr:isochorismatase family cysteine hydrolase [Sporomusa acidovorans]OZC16718.1 N-carbamoylsarcosine amidase [Sporomusa acidovorans DSM 3132]SDE04912.1 Nicotinamidase-related amidase [Sporomusa acidovorans]